MSRRHGMTMRVVAGALFAGSMLLANGVSAGAQHLAGDVSHLIVPRASGGSHPDAPPPDALVAEGQELYDAGHYKEAAAQFERAIQLGVARPHEAARKVARSYAKLGNEKQARRWAQIAWLMEHPEWAERPLRTSLLLKI